MLEMPLGGTPKNHMTEKNFQTGVQLILAASAAGTPHHESILSLGDTPQYLIDHDFPKLPLVVKGSTIDKAFYDHGISKKILERLIAIIHNPKALYRSATVQGSAVVITFEVKNDSPILVPLHPNKPLGRSFTANLVASVYHKEPTIETRWQQRGLLLWKKK